MNSVCSYRVDRGLQKILSLLSESGVCSFWAVCHGRPRLCDPWLENGAVCHCRGAGLCFLVHMVCVLSFCHSAAFEQWPTSWSFLTGHTAAYSVTITVYIIQNRLTPKIHLPTGHNISGGFLSLRGGCSDREKRKKQRGSYSELQQSTKGKSQRICWWG